MANRFITRAELIEQVMKTTYWEAFKKKAADADKTGVPFYVKPIDFYGIALK